jgi:murein DD-endopeptidase MepM/ murein hydrolase activator NlpD
MLREDVVAPALVLVVILGVWWIGARVISEFWSPRNPVADPQMEPGRAAEAVAPGEIASPEPAAPADLPANADTTGAAGTADTAEAVVSQDDVDTLRARRLRIPVEGVEQATLISNFHQSRGAGSHEAIDIMSPRGTPVLAVEGGRIAKLFTSKKGGLTIYQFDPSESFCYYYAHLDRYAHTLDEGKVVSAGEVIGYVGSTGNASPDAPHLHFAVFKLGPDRRWWQGLPIDPYLVLR